MKTKMGSFGASGGPKPPRTQFWGPKYEDFTIQNGKIAEVFDARHISATVMSLEARESVLKRAPPPL